MSYRDITAGDKKAKVVAGRFIKSSKGTMGIEVAFEFEEPTTNTQERMNWVGWLSEKALENTMDTLVNVLCFNGNDNVNQAGEFTDPNVFDFNKEVKLVVEMEEYDGKTRAKIKWVNNVGGSGFQGITPEVIRGELAATGFKAAFLSATQGKPKAVETTPLPASAVPF